MTLAQNTSRVQPAESEMQLLTISIFLDLYQYKILNSERQNFIFGNTIMNLATILVCQLLTVTSAYNILFMVPFPGPSHWLFMVKFVDELLERGHQLTVVTSFPRKGPINENYTEILMNPVYDFPSCEYFIHNFTSKHLY